MGLFFTILFLSILALSKLFYLSFVHGEDIYILGFFIHNLTLIFLFYILIVLCTLFLYLQKKDIFLEKPEFMRLVYLHSLFTLSLLFNGIYIYSILLQFLLLFSLYKRKIFIYFYIIALIQILVILFSVNYILYFINLGALIYFLLKDPVLMGRKAVFYYLVGLITLSFFYIKYEAIFYQLYLWLDVVEQVVYVDFEIVAFVLILQFFLFILIAYKTKNLTFFIKK